MWPIGATHVRHSPNHLFSVAMVAEFKMVGAGLACSGLGGVGQGIGTIFSSLVEALAQNPGMSKGLSNYALIGFALTEAVAPFILMITFLILF